MAFNSIPFNRTSGIGEGVNAAAQNFLRAYQMRKERQLQEREAGQRERLTDIQIQNAEREAQMAPLREALIRGQAFQAGVKPAESASDTTFNLPTLSTLPGTPAINAPAFTVPKNERYVPLGGGTLPISQVSDATIANVPERGGFVYDTMDNPVARARNQQAAAERIAADNERTRASQALQMAYTRAALQAAQQSRQNEFTAGQNALNRANAQETARIRHGSAGATTSQRRQAIQAQISALRAQIATVPTFNAVDRAMMTTPEGQARITESEQQLADYRSRLDDLYRQLGELGDDSSAPALPGTTAPSSGAPVAAQRPLGAATEPAAAGRSPGVARALELKEQGLTKQQIATILKAEGYAVKSGGIQ